jgi:Methyltransferase domain
VVVRALEPELLDELPPDDPSAVGSRRDLVRLNGWMGHRRIMAQALRSSCDPPTTRRLIELGAGDGRFLLNVAQSLSADWRGTTAVLVDRHRVVSPETQQGFQALGWRLALIEADVFDWLGRPTVAFSDVVLANLFLHHFSNPQLTRLLAEAARLAKAFVALEPRRAAWPLTCSHLLWMIGCNRVTQNDAPVSVRAGFAGDELSHLWPGDEAWTLDERPAGWCSHLFIARRATDQRA